MIRILFLTSLFISLQTNAQPNAYHEWLTNIPEIKVGDSLPISIPPDIPKPTAEEKIKAFLSPIYMETPKKQICSVTGKITSGNDYDILLVYRYNFYSDSLWMKLYLLCTMSKSGSLLHFTVVAENLFDPKMGNRESVSSYYKDGSFITTMTGVLMKQPFHSRRRYTINHHGVVVPDAAFSTSADHKDLH